MARYSNNKLQNKSVEELQIIKNKLQQSKRRTAPVPLQRGKKLSNRQLRSMSVEDLQNLKKDLTSKPSAGIDKEFLINIKDSLEEYMKIYLPNEYANLNKFQQNDYTTTSGTRDWHLPVNCTDIYAINYNPDATTVEDCCYDNDCLVLQGHPGIYGVNLYGDLPYPSTGELDGLVNVLDVITLVSYILGDGAPEYYIPPYHVGDECGVCCDDVGSCCGSGCTLCDGICSDPDICMDPGTCPSVTYNDILIQGGSNIEAGITVYNVIYYPINDERFWPIVSNEQFLENINSAFDFSDGNTHSVTVFTGGNSNVAVWNYGGSGSWMEIAGPDFTSMVGGIVIASTGSGTLNWGNAL